MVWDQLKTNDINETDSFEIICMEDFFWQSSHLVYQPLPVVWDQLKTNDINKTDSFEIICMEDFFLAKFTFSISATSGGVGSTENKRHQ